MTVSAAPRPHVDLQNAVVRFAGDSGDGMQLTGTEFTREAALYGNDLATFPDYPAEIRAPAGTTAGVSGYQIQFAAHEVYSAGDQPDTLVAMNPAALKVHLPDLKRGGLLILNEATFKQSDLDRAGWKTNPLTDGTLENYQVIKVDFERLVGKAVEGTGVLHELSKYRRFQLTTFQAEDEIAAISAAIGASFAGALGVTGSSGPGIALKTEAMGLALMTELPLVIINVQRGGPSTGLPTKTEQSDLFQAVYGRNGECPIPVLAARSPADCFDTAYEACRIAIDCRTPVILLSDGSLANGSEPWLLPDVNSLPKIDPGFATDPAGLMPYKRDDKLALTLPHP